MSWQDNGRYELKYVLPVAAKDAILAVTTAHAAPDPHARALGNGALGYSVRTLYLDTPELDDYFERLEGRRIRNRLRIRTYGNPGEQQPVFVENKRKLKRWVVKQRLEVCSAEAWAASTSPRPWQSLIEQAAADSYAGRHFLGLTEGRQRVPVSLVQYQREVWIDRTRIGVRLTIDQGVSATVAGNAQDLFAAPRIDLIPPEWLVMELKFPDDPSWWMQEICRRLAVCAVPVSKFGLSVAKGIRGGRPHELRYLTPPPLRGRGEAA